MANASQSVAHGNVYHAPISQLRQADGLRPLTTSVWSPRQCRPSCVNCGGSNRKPLQPWSSHAHQAPTAATCALFARSLVVYVRRCSRLLGPFGFELFARDVDAVHKEMTSDGAFAPQTPPTDFDLSGIGSGLCRSFAAKGPGNVWVLITTMLSVPPPRALPITHHFVGPVVTMPIAALNRAVAVEFYAGVLGIPIRFDGSVRDRDVNRIMGAGDDWQMHITVFFIEDGQLVEHHFHTPGDLMETPVNPGSLLNGPAIYTFTVTDIDAIVAAARDRQIQVRGPIVLDAFPYSRRRVACLDGPNHELVEIVAAELG